MLERVSSWLQRHVNGWIALLGLVVFLLFSALVLPAQSAQSQVYSETAGSPDGSFFYTPQDLYRMAEAYGAAGRAAYVQARVTFDVVWPLVYTFFLVTAISWAASKAGVTAAPWRWVNLLPLCSLFLDYLENLGAVIVMLRYPAPTPIIDLLTTWFTPLKWALLGASFVVLAGLMGLAVWRRLVGRGH